MIGRPYFGANSKSRSSCAGTAMTAPVPYSPSTKLATQMGTGSPVNGLIADAAGVEAFLLDLAGQARDAILRAEPVACASRSAAGSRRLGGEPLDQRVLGREQDEGRAVDRVDARREDLDRRADGVPSSSHAAGT